MIRLFFGFLSLIACAICAYTLLTQWGRQGVSPYVCLALVIMIAFDGFVSVFKGVVNVERGR